ncbi:MAG: class I SAM-dependent methyltransferase, partial [bacterium]|nr:class I SAM-dependent methyltransferase [bacterium]
MSGRYYTQKLSAERLRRCYELAPPRVKRYLEAEIGHVLSRIGPGDTVLELGCGYGRILRRIAGRARRAVGIDTSPESLRLAGGPNIGLARMDAAELG